MSMSISSPPPPPSPQPTPHHPPVIPSRVLTPLAASVAAAFSCLLLLSFLLRKLFRRKPTFPTSSSPSPPPHRFSYSLLRRSTRSFHPSLRLGQGGSGSVYSTCSSSSAFPSPLAVKLIDSTSLQAEREFQNELFFAGIVSSPYTLPALGFSFNKKGRRMLIAYPLMPNGNLQDALLHRKCPELMPWHKRFTVILDVARGIQHLHFLDPPVIHGDVKPSNVLLDKDFSAKIGDFGLARLKSAEAKDGNVSNQCEVPVVEHDAAKEKSQVSESKKPEPENEGNFVVNVDDGGSAIEDTESVYTATTATGFEDCNLSGVEQSPENFVRIPISEASPDPVGTSPGVVVGMSPQASLMSKSVSGKDWWWKQDGGGSTSGKVKDYVMEWIGTEIKKERPKSDWLGGSAPSTCPPSKQDKEKSVKKNRKRLDWWVSMEEEKDGKRSAKKEKRRPAREWWREEYCEELARKKKKKRRQMGEGGQDNNCAELEDDSWLRDDDMMYAERKKRSKNRSRRSSKGSVDWWLDGLSGDLWRGRRNSYDSGEIPRSGGVSSTPSMRGTVCYVAPEYGGGGDLSEKCDVYSYGVLMLVIIAGRRPLQVTGSPMSEFQRANLLSWARHLARSGKLLDLVDQSIQNLNREQAMLCITVALLCVQKSPGRRPSMKEAVEMLTGAMEPPRLPVEFSPSPPSRFPYKSQRKAAR
ncbi:hypothetical protein MLD38_025642 [Melastoma candidum]|uniref:Uncharacterized protein n=1 Tax=Melastoma candidum TaxID=119954 RepID=A0ACB9NXT8_9MYRT|nr:hypothetical protein MLD38_025642 [Melastoma candidum]